MDLARGLIANGRIAEYGVPAEKWYGRAREWLDSAFLETVEYRVVQIPGPWGKSRVLETLADESLARIVPYAYTGRL